MEILVRYWNADTNIAETSYVKSEFLGDANDGQILKSFEYGIAKLNYKRFFRYPLIDQMST